MIAITKYKEILKLCTGVQNNKDVKSWETLYEFEHTSKNKNFTAKVYKKENETSSGKNSQSFFEL